MPSFERGDVYPSTGVVLEEVVATDKNLAVMVKIKGASNYRVQFVGRGGL